MFLGPVAAAPAATLADVDPDTYDDFLAPLPADRAAAVKEWLGSAIKICAGCNQPIRVMDSHRRVKDDLLHTACAPADNA